MVSVCVRNTFLHCEELIDQQPVLLRAGTAPLLQKKCISNDSDALFQQISQRSNLETEQSGGAVELKRDVSAESSFSLSSVSDSNILLHDEEDSWTQGQPALLRTVTAPLPHTDGPDGVADQEQWKDGQPALLRTGSAPLLCRESCDPVKIKLKGKDVCEESSDDGGEEMCHMLTGDSPSGVGGCHSQGSWQLAMAQMAFQNAAMWASLSGGLYPPMPPMPPTPPPGLFGGVAAHLESANAEDGSDTGSDSEGSGSVGDTMCPAASTGTEDKAMSDAAVGCPSEADWHNSGLNMGFANAAMWPFVNGGLYPPMLLGCIGNNSQMSSRGANSKNVTEIKPTSVPGGRSGPQKVVGNYGQEASVKEADRTTLMIRNLPNMYSRDDVLKLLSSRGFAGKFDFLYYPIDFQTHQAMGYAFVNMQLPEDAKQLSRNLDGFSDWRVRSSKVCSVSWSQPLQGLEANVARYRNSPMMHESVPDAYRPMLFADGKRIPFSEPTKKLKPPRKGTQRLLV